MSDLSLLYTLFGHTMHRSPFLSANPPLSLFWIRMVPGCHPPTYFWKPEVGASLNLITTECASISLPSSFDFTESEFPTTAQDVKFNGGLYPFLG